MGKLVVTEFLTLDGVMESPETWSLSYWNDQIAGFKETEGRNADALLLGRRTYEGFAEAWPSRTGEYADRLNSQPKYVVSDTLADAGWANSEIIRRNDALSETIAALRDKHSGDIVVHGSGTLARWLLANRLFDELRLILYPLLRGTGKRLFDGAGEVELNLSRSEELGSGVGLLVYRPTAN